MSTCGKAKKTFRLGDKLNEAYKVWADRLQKPSQARTVGELLDRYALEVIPAKAPASQQSNHVQMLVLRRVFGNQPLLPFAPQLVYQYVDRRSVKKKDPKTGKAPGWKSMWQRYMDRVIKETKVENHFTEHDLRAKVASDAGTLEHARSLLAHADSRTTDRIYRRKAEVVKPLR